MGWELLFLLLPVAALSGWLAGRRGRASASRGGGPLSSEYFKGLNYLLNEQPDKAIEVFVRMVEVDGETIETHFALGNLFRRRGEVERAIRIHQNLIARPTLSRAHRLQALYELGCDYMRAGVLDRAENLFVEVAEEPAWAEQALQELLDIYQQEKDWPNAIATARRLRDSVGPAVGKVIAQYHCELADEARREPDLPKATRLIKKALQEDPDCVRASLMEAELLLAQENPKAAIRALKRVERQDPGFLPETIDLLQEAYRALGRPLELMHYLRQLLREHGGTTILNALVQLMRQQQGDRDAALFLADYLKKNPSVRGMERLIELKATHSTDSSVRDELEILRGLAVQLAETKPAYRCENCGFEGRTLHWQCPSCKQWSRIKHIHSVDVD